MKIVIHNLHNGSNKTLEGDEKTLMRELRQMFPWATDHANDVDHALAEIDRHQFYAVEVKDPSAHPFLKE